MKGFVSIIEAAIKGGLKAEDIFPDKRSIYHENVVLDSVKEFNRHCVGITFRRTGDNWRWTSSINTYRLVFDNSLRFMECLIGEADTTCVNGECPYYEKGSEPGNCAGWANGKSALAANCKSAILAYLPASYHRSVMAYLPNIESIKKYLIDLVNKSEVCSND